MRLSDEKIKSITSNAICHFKQCKFETLQTEAEDLRYVDVYGEAIEKYPLAWSVLKRAARTGDTVDVFKKLQEADFEKVLHVLQIILQSGKAFVTCNYYISDGRIEKRRRILKVY